MIQKKVIDTIYKKYHKAPSSVDELNIALLFEQLPLETGIEISNGDVVINSVESTSPFRRIPLANIHAILNFDEAIAIVTHASILFINKDDGQVNVHIKKLGLTLLQRLLPGRFSH